MTKKEKASVTDGRLNASEMNAPGANTGTGWEILQGLKEDVGDWYKRHRGNNVTAPLVWMLFILVTLMTIMAILLPFDAVRIEGRPRLIKPLNFTFSMATYIVVVIMLIDYLRASFWWKTVISWGVSLCLLIAISSITLQAARGTTSHFNKDTPFDSTVTMLMDIVDPLNGVFAVVLLIFALKSRYEVSRPVQWGIVFGFLGLLLGNGYGGVMVFLGQNVVGVEPGGPGLPMVNWSTQGGDLRVAHFFGIHALQILPIVGWLVSQLQGFGMSMRAQLTQVSAVSGAYILFTVILFLQALSGTPILRM